MMHKQILEFWFGSYLEPNAKLLPDLFKKWFASTPEFDEEIRRRFSNYLQQVVSNEAALEELQATPMGIVASIILLDQFPRNIFRGSARMFAFDDLARQAATSLLAEPNLDLKPAMKMFIYLPFEHHEDLSSQRLSVSLFEKLAIDNQESGEKALIDSAFDYAKRHLTIIERFGRFPHRNVLLDRPTTSEEAEYLQNGGETFSALK